MKSITKTTTELTQERYDSKLKDVAQRAVNFAKTGNGWYSMRNAFDELCEQSGANNGINHDATVGRRKLLAQSVCLQCIRVLSKDAVDRLQNKLYEISEDYNSRQARGFHR